MIELQAEGLDGAWHGFALESDDDARQKAEAIHALGYCIRGKRHGVEVFWLWSPEHAEELSTQKEGHSMTDSPDIMRCTFEGCPRTMTRTRDDAYRSRPPAEGWVAVQPGWRCPDHHEFEITFDEALEELGHVWAAVDQEFLAGRHEQEASDLDYQAVVRAFERGRPSTQ
jgi:hypothetical protein